MTNSLKSVYEMTKSAEKQPFNADQITDALMAEPLNVDISCIIVTPQTVIVQKTKDDYLNHRIVAVIKSKFEVESLCKDDKLIFS